jgi:diguanylate cyclase (GGDEF)-like protein/PAS domain S-box-containing protein
MNPMNAPMNNLSGFARYFWLALGLFLVFGLTFVGYVWTEKQIDHANVLRQQSLLLAEELWQSSEDLTRMVRTYVVTGDPIYRQHFQEILDIRDGRKPRPLDYGNVYWDLVQADNARPRPTGPAVPLLELLRRAGFTNDEFAKLAEAKAKSDGLTRTEFAAMALVESTNPVSEANRAQAIRMLYDAAYHQAKAEIMRPIGEFLGATDKRTLEAVHAAEARASWARAVFVVLGLLLTYLLFRMYRELHAILGSQVDDLHARIVRLGSGDLLTPIPVAKGMENSITGWLSETQIKLAKLDAQRTDVETRHARLTKLYAALSLCNQAIVRCNSEAELFMQICREIVTNGGMTMAWIGLVDEERRYVRPIASFGRNTEYLEDLQISLDADHPTGRGPIGTAYRQGQAYWCQDFQHDPGTSAWHERAARFGWAASAAIPLHRDGTIIGLLCPYSGSTNAFDDEARALFLEMASDIDFALKNFDREAQRTQAEKALRHSEQHLRTIIETEPECIKVVGSDGMLLQMNRAGLDMLEAQTLHEAQQQNLIDYILPEYRKHFSVLHQRVMRGGTGTLEFEIEGLAGTRRWLETHAAPLHDASGESTMLLGITRDITSRKTADEQIQYLAHFDSLTGLPNRAQLNDLTTYAISLAQRSNQPVALLFLDIDNFKDINDTLGHSAGDALLVELANRLREVLRDEDKVARFGGDEFIFLLYGADAQGAAQVAQKLLQVIDAPCKVDQYDLNVTASIGIALYPNDGADMETLIRCADAAMYRVKQEGRHGYHFFTAEMQLHSARHLRLINALRQALERNQLHIHYQPQVSLEHGRIVGAEALLRWTHPELGSVPPAEFIPAAESSGLILPIGEWVLRHAVRQLKSWMEDGVAPLVMAVNLSAAQFRHADLPKLITRILDEEGLPPEYLELELTEGVAMHDPQGAIAVMNNLHERGVRMSIDDFGTGYSSLSQLKKFKVYKLKIDQSFVRDISTDPEDKAIVAAIIHMAKSLGLQTIAEGVETPGQLAFLREQGCQEMQGYFYSRPLPADQFEAFVRAKS